MDNNCHALELEELKKLDSQQMVALQTRLKVMVKEVRESMCPLKNSDILKKRKFIILNGIVAHNIMSSRKRNIINTETENIFGK